MEEVWKDIEGYEGLYQVSNMGRVRSLDREVKHIYGKQLKKGKILVLCNNRKGYKHVNLCKCGKINTHEVHRLVAKAFIPNPEKLRCINHRDENPENNRVDNLEWCTNKYNSNYGTIKNRLSEKHTNGKNSKPVLQYTLDYEFVREWPSTKEVQRELGFDSSSIARCCRKARYYNTAYGSIWMYKEKGAA